MIEQIEILNIASVPYGEDCVQVGSAQYSARANKECRVFRNQLIRLHGEPPAGCSIIIKGFPHEFGRYYEVCAKFDPDDEIAADYAYNLESEGPEYWDEEAKKELKAGSEVIKTENKIPIVDVPMTMDSVVDIECPHCGAARRVEPDANYTVICDCGKKYKCVSQI